MVTEAKTTNYWISNSALYIQLNATGEPNRIQASVVSGASILCYMQGIDGLGYDAGHNYQRWTLAAYPSEFPSDEKRYVYVAIPRKRTSGNDIATIVFPSQKIDIYGKAIVLKTDEDGKQEEVVGDQIGSEDYYYIYLQGIISEVYLNNANDRVRKWVQDVDFGSLSTDEALASGGVAQWWKYNSVSDTVTFLKTIFSATFDSLVAKTISVKELFFGKKKITGIASDQSQEDSEEEIVTPNYLKKYGGGKYLSKVKDDTAEGLINFAKGLIIKGLGDLATGAASGYNAKITELGEAVFSAIKSLDYDNAAEQGFSVEKEKNGKYHAFFTNLTIWGKAIFHEIEVRKLSYSGGNIYLSGAGSKLIKVVPVKQSVSADGATSWVETTEDDVECVGWKCYLLADDGTTATMNDWQEGDQARCQTMGEIVTGGTYTDASNKSYWRTIPDGGVSTQNEKIYGTKLETYLDEDGNEQTKEVQVELYDGQAFAWIVIGKHCGDIDGYDDEFGVGYNSSNPAPLETRDIPSAGDTIVLDGNRHRNEHGEYDKTDRQNVIILETTGEYAPRIACYANISEYKHTITKSVNGSDKEVSLSVFETSPKGGTKINSSRFEWISDDGSTINIINYRGDWVSTNTYHKNDQVNHNNAVWVCVANSGVDVTDPPSDGSSNWKKVLSGGKGEKGDDAVSYSVSLMKELRTIAGHSNQSAVAVSFRKQEGSKSTVSGNIATFGDSASVKCYIDGERSDNMTDWINIGNDYFGYLNYEDAWAGKSVITVVMYIGDNIVASANFSLGQSGEGVVMAYKNATSRPSKPTVEDLSQLSDGWSRTPQKGGSYLKVDNISYGSFDNGASSSVDSTSKSWTYVTEGGNSWKKSPSGLSDNYGWAIMKVSFSTNVDNLDVKVIIKAYSEGNYDFIQVHALDTEITVSSSLRKTGVAYTSGNSVEDSYSYHVATAGQHFFYVSYCKDSSGHANGDYGLFRFDLSDNLVSMPSTVWMSQAVLKDGKAVLPWSTPVQITGDDAYRVEVSPSTLVFDTNENGLVDSATLSGKYATVTVYKGNQKISADNLSLPSNYATKKYTNVDGKISNVNEEARITIDRIEQETISGDEKVSKSSGQISFPIDVFGERSTLMWVTVNVQVNVSKFTGSVAFDNKGYKAQFDELSKNAATKDELKDVTSTFEQTARKISLSVSEKSVGRRNMLVGSACRKYGDGFMYMSGGYYDGYPLEQIEKNSGIDGVNCIHCRTKQTGTGSYYLSGFRWHGVSPQGNIKLEKGKNYVLSFYAKTHTPNDIYFHAEVLYQGSKIDTSRPAGYDGPTGYSTTFAASEAGKWELFTVKVSVPSNAKYEYVEINIFAKARGYSFVDGYICKPMLEEGENYNGWTLSEQDYDYVGGNLLDNARTLDKSGTLFDINDTVIQNGYGTDSACIKNLIKANATLSDYKEVLKWIFGSTYLVNGNDYIFSFVAKAEVDDARVVCYMWSGDLENSCDIFTEGNGGTWDSRGDGNVVFILSRQWTRYWVHWRPKDGYATPKEVIIRHTGNNSTSTSTVYVTQPKLEIGATMTEWTERKSDLVDKASLKAAGIEVTANKVKLYGNQIEVKPTKEGNAVYALFGDDGFINTNILNVQHVYAKNASGTVYGHFGYLGATGGTDSDGYQYPLWVGASTCGSAPFSVRSDGYIYATKGKIGPLNMDEKGLFYHPLDINAELRIATDLRIGGLWVSESINACNSELMVGNRCWGFDPLNESKQLQFTSTTLFSYPVIHPSVMIAKRWTNLGNGDSRTDPASPALMVESEGVGITSNGLNYLGGMAMGCTRTSVIDNDTLTAMNLNRISFVVMTNGSEYTFPMPKTPVIGQILIVVQGNAKINFDPQGNTIYCGGKIKTTSDKFYSSTVGQFNIFIYDGYYWQLQWINQKP